MVVCAILSAVMGGMAGLAYALTQGHGIGQAILSYQLGGLLALMAFSVMVLRLPARQGTDEHRIDLK